MLAGVPLTYVDGKPARGLCEPCAAANVGKAVRDDLAVIGHELSALDCKKPGVRYPTAAVPIEVQVWDAMNEYSHLVLPGVGPQEAEVFLYQLQEMSAGGSADCEEMVARASRAIMGCCHHVFMYAGAEFGRQVEAAAAQDEARFVYSRFDGDGDL